MNTLSPKNIYKSMKRVNLWLHFFRNNARFRTRFYHEFMCWVGYTEWGNVEPTVKHSWESASNSFDKLFGLMGVFRHLSNPQEIIKKPDDDVCKDSIIAHMEKAVSFLKSVYEYEIKHHPTSIEYECIINLLEKFAEKNDLAEKEICLAYLKSKRGLHEE